MKMKIDPHPINSVLNVECSMFDNIKSVTPKNVNLLDWLNCRDHLERQIKLRAISDPQKQAEMKEQFPCITVSGVFSKRGKDFLLNHTGIMAIDIDFQDNQHLSNFSELKQEISKIQNVAYCGQSIRGKGFFALIPIRHPKNHLEHFLFIESYFKAKGITIDPSCKDIGRLRYYSYDEQAYFNHSAKPLEALYRPPIQSKPISLPISASCDNKPVWALYNDSDDFIRVLGNHGWRIERKRESKIYFTRPGKSSGVSAEYDHSKNVFFVFTSSSIFEGGKGYNPFQVYAILEHQANFREAAKALRAIF